MINKDDFLLKIEEYYRKQDSFGKKYCIDFMKHLAIAFSQRKKEGTIMLLDKDFENYYGRFGRLLEFHGLIILSRLEKVSHFTLQQEDLSFLDYNGVKYFINFEVLNGDKVVKVFKRFAYLLNLTKKNDFILEGYFLGNLDNEICIKKTTSGLERDELNEDFLVNTKIVTAPKIIKLFDVLVKNRKNYVTMKELQQRSIFKSKSDLLKTIADLRKFLGDTVENKSQEYKYLMTGNDGDNTIYYLQVLKGKIFER